jgi:hypothetical protein
VKRQTEEDAMPKLALDEETIEAIARRVAELLDGSDRPQGAELLTAAQVADRFAVSRAYVYEHAGRLGAIRLSDGPKARLRFDPKRVAEALAPKPFAPKPSPTPEAAIDAPPIRCPSPDQGEEMNFDARPILCYGLAAEERPAPPATVARRALFRQGAASSTLAPQRWRDPRLTAEWRRQPGEFLDAEELRGRQLLAKHNERNR